MSGKTKYYISEYVKSLLRDAPNHDWISPELIRRSDLFIAEMVADFWDCDEATALVAIGQVRECANGGER
tara:strand:- start:400 stop:609 length:210 start_codon:yes stop_codon:yes gene_type:complete